MGKIMKNKRGITLVALVVTIVVLIILAAVTIAALAPGGILDKSIQSKFVSNYKSMEEWVYIYKSGQEMEEYKTDEEILEEVDKLPLNHELTNEEKQEIREKIPTLEEEIIARNPGQTLEQIRLYEIDKEKIGAGGIKHKYLIDITTGKLYDYEGEYFQKQRWHTLEGGENAGEDYEDMFNGWIRLTLYYPENSTDRKWLLKGEGEIREEDWKDYTGPIWVQLDRVQDIYIKYKINEEEIVIPPSGKVGVIIEPEKYEVGIGEKTKVKIIYEEGVETKEYKVAGGSWQTYQGEFEVGVNTLIQARAERMDSIYDGEGNKIGEKSTWGYDTVYIREKGTEPGGWQEEGTGGTTTGGGGTGGSSDSGNPGGGGTSPVEQPKAPTIQVTENKNGEYTESVEVGIQTPERAEKIYIKIGSGKWEEYTEKVTVTKNCMISAYYITEEGKTSKTAYRVIDMIQKQGKPYVSIKATPYPYPNAKKVKEVEIEVVSKVAQKVEYSTDGIIYKPYEGSFKVTENGIIKARATNEQGTTYDTLNITNIGEGPTLKENLDINIIAKPDPLVSNKKVDKVTIKIEYDERAEEKYYSIGQNGEIQEYKGEFEITENTIIYAYAKSKTGEGQEYKVINNLKQGITPPEIVASPRNNAQASKVKIQINYDPEATIKRYEINGDGLRDYIGEFEVQENCTIRAYSENEKGEKAESTYEVENITQETAPIIIDMGDYYIIKLNYPQGSTGREYKIKETGEWTGYKEQGILMVKPEYKDKLLDENGQVKIQIKDETGKEVNWKGTVYVLEGSITEIVEDIYMRWDTVEPNAPQIILNTEEPAREVTVNIIYSNTLKKKQYKIIEPDGETTGWKDYEGPFTVTRKNTVVLAKGMNQSEVWGKEARKQITNIDEQQPEIKLTADLETKTQELDVKVEATDDVRVAEVKWAKGVQGESYFETQGEAILNNSIVKITENGYYTFYAVDGVGNKQVYTINVTNIDQTAPEIQITITPEDKIVLDAKAEIDYGDSITKQYKIGENGTWQNYTGEITLNAYEIINQELLNEDKTVTIYAKGTDSAGNEKEVSKKVVNIDLDMPKAPEIQSNYGYPILTEYGVKVDGETKITYDDRNDIENYYSLDNGTTWLPYEGTFTAKEGTILAKSVKKASGLTIQTSKEIGMPADAIGPEAYDGNDGTAYSVGRGEKKYINIDSSVKGKEVSIIGYVSKYCWIGIINSNGEEEKILNGVGNINKTIEIPIDAEKISLGMGTQYGETARINEIRFYDGPEFEEKRYYPTITEEGVNAGYNEVKINYVSTSVQRLYKIDEGEWKEYKGETIRLEIGQTIYAKGIDKYGNDTYVVTSYTSNLLEDAIGSAAYDGDDGTAYEVARGEKKYINIDSSVKGKEVSIIGYVSKYCWIGIINSNGEEEKILNGVGNINQTIEIPIDAERISLYKDTGYNLISRINEIRFYDGPEFEEKRYYPTITEEGVNAGYNEVKINYVSTSVQRLYKIDEGEWKEYKGETIRLEIGQTIYAKGIDKYGNDTYVVTSYTSNLLEDAIGPEAYDGNDGTAYSVGRGEKKYINIDSSVKGKEVSIIGYVSKYCWIGIINSNGEEEKILAGVGNINKTIEIPIDAEKISLGMGTQYGETARINEIRFYNQPSNK